MNNFFFKLLELDPEDEVESIFMGILSDIDLKHGSDVIALFPREDILITGLNLRTCLAV